MHFTKIIRTRILSNGNIYLDLADGTILQVVQPNSYIDTITGEVYPHEECLFDEKTEELLGFIW